MRDAIRNFPVNWVNGMKISKDHFIAQDNSWRDAVQDITSLQVSPVRYGVLPSSAAGEVTFNVKTSFDNQRNLRVSVHACNAITSGGVRIILPSIPYQQQTDGVPATSIFLTPSATDNLWWIVLTVNPFERQPAGQPDREETPIKFPFVLPSYKVEVVSDTQFTQYNNNPYSLTIGKIICVNNEVIVDENYIPPCFSISAHDDAKNLHADIDTFLGKLEMQCSLIVQKIFKKNQPNEISDLVQFLCDRVMLYLGSSITDFRWKAIHESPVVLISTIASLARIIKNTIDLRIGSGKEEMMNYLCEWCELKQGELESMTTSVANMRYDHNDINKNVEKLVVFVKVISKLFETLSKLEFIGKRKDTGIFVKEEKLEVIEAEEKAKRRRFFG